MQRLSSSVEVLAERLCRPQRVGLFGQRGVGKTTLLTMLYREGAGGRLPGCRLAAADARTAHYLAEKILQLESGQFLPGTLAETELCFYLYQDQARIELVLKDYQGEHVELGREEPIHAFFRDCDTVWLCLDAPTVAGSGPLLRRQQEIEQLLEDYLEREPLQTIGRPVAVLMTKADLLDSEEPENIPCLERLDMTRHALKTHCPESVLFAVNSLRSPVVHAPGSPAHAPGSPYAVEPSIQAPAASFTLSTSGLTDLLVWLATSLQAQDEARLEQLFARAEGRCDLLDRCVEAFARRYPTASATDLYRRQLQQLRQRQRRRRGLSAAAAVACLLVGLGAYDAVGYRKVARFSAEHGDDPAATLARWEHYRDWHPTRNLLKPNAGQEEKQCVQELEKELRQRACAERLRELQGLAADAGTDVEALAGKLQRFLADYPEVDSAESETLRAAVSARRSDWHARRARAAFEDLVRAEELPDADLSSLVARADKYVRDFPQSAHEAEVHRRRSAYRYRLDERDIEVARTYSARNPFHFQTRREHYLRYLEKHPSGGAFTREAETAVADIARQWDRHDFRVLRDQFEKNPADISNLVVRCRSYLAAHPQGKFVPAASDLLRWSERVSATRAYRVTLRNGSIEKKLARFFSRGPDLSVELEVNGVRYGPSTIVVNRYEPEWDFEFPRPVAWKLGDPVRIRVIDHDWSDRVVLDVESEEGDALALRLLTGEVWSGGNRLTFTCDFALPVLPRIE